MTMTSNRYPSKGVNYSSKFYLHYVKRLVDNRLVDKIAEKCSNNIVFHLATSLNKELKEFPRFVHGFFNIGDEKFYLEMDEEGSTLILKLNRYGNNQDFFSDLTHQFKIQNYENLNKKDLINQLRNELMYTSFYARIENLDSGINDFLDCLSDFPTTWTTDIEELDDDYRGEDLKNVFGLVLREILVAKAKYKPDDCIIIFDELLAKKKYRFSFFRRLILYTISKVWNNQNALFFKKMIRNDDENGYFAKYDYNKELFQLLSKNVHNFDKDEKYNIRQIIEKGSKEEKTQQHLDYWKLRWYSALKEDNLFKEDYLRLSRKLNVQSEHYENLGKVRITRGDYPPLTVEEVLAMPNKAIAKYIFEFNPEDRFEKPTIGGLADTIQACIKQNPSKFAEDLDVFKDVYYIYAYHIIIGFKDTYTKEQNFNLQKVLGFCLDYINSDKFNTDALKLENDSWNADVNWVIGAIGNLITEGVRYYDKPIEENVLITIRQILEKLIPNLEPVTDFKMTNMDYPTYSLNSTSGKLLRALLDFSLRKAWLTEKDKTVKWDDCIKQLFQTAIDKKILDTYILQGWYFEHFNYLDSDWIIAKTKEYYSLEDTYWLAFMSGFVFHNPLSKEIYNCMKPHYIRAIDAKIEFKGGFVNGLINHLFAYYIWEYEDLVEDTLITRFLYNANEKEIEELLRIISIQHEHLVKLDETEQKRVTARVIKLWSVLLELKKEVPNLVSVIEYVNEMTNDNFNLITQAIELAKDNYWHYIIIENLDRIKNFGDATKTAFQLMTILDKIDFKDYFMDEVKKQLVSVITFIYENGDDDCKVLANNFCNKITKKKRHVFERCL